MPGPPLFDRAAIDRQVQQLPSVATTGTIGALPSVGVGESAPMSKWPYVALLAGQAADAGTTIAALHNPALHETNPLGEVGMLGGKIAVTAALAALMHHEAQQGNDHAVKLIGTIGGALGVGPAIWNIAQMAKTK